MRALVTGATGKVGHATVQALLAGGYDVRALVHGPEDAARALPAAVEAIRGDVTVREGLDAAAAGCELVFMAHGLPEQWLADPSAFQRVNVDGAVAVVRAAIAAGARRVVHTSTIDVFAEAGDGCLRETNLARHPKRTAYQRSKQRAEEAVLAAARDAVEVVLVNPAAVYGPGPRGSASFEIQLFEPVVRSQRLKLPFLPPGGASLVYSEGMGRGQVLAAERGSPGERYILSDTYVTVRDLAETVRRLAGRGRVPPTLPAWLVRVLSTAGEALAGVIRRPPLVPKGQLEFLLARARADSSKAQDAIGWQPTPLEDGLRHTLADLDL
jgi:dihydroflavonol-4-reductase